MSITINIYYSGENGNARKFAEEMENSGTAENARCCQAQGLPAFGTLPFLLLSYCLKTLLRKLFSSTRRKAWNM